MFNWIKNNLAMVLGLSSSLGVMVASAGVAVGMVMNVFGGSPEMPVEAPVSPVIAPVAVSPTPTTTKPTECLNLNLEDMRRFQSLCSIPDNEIFAAEEKEQMIKIQETPEQLLCNEINVKGITDTMSVEAKNKQGCDD